MQVGEITPDISLPDQDGTIWSWSRQPKPSKYTVVFFYPKDMTPGCSRQACDFRDQWADFRALDCCVVGISKDSVARHQRFVAKHDLSFRLLSDAQGDVCQQYGVWVEKSMFGKKYLGIRRSTFLLDEDCRVLRAWPKVSVANHVAEVYQTLLDVVDQVFS